MAKKKKEKKYPELIHIRVNEEILKILKNKSNFSNFIRQRILNDYKYKENLHFLNEFFKENIDHLMKSKKIVDFVLENDEVFKEIERLINNNEQ